VNDQPTGAAPARAAQKLPRFGWSMVALGLALVALSVTFLVIDIGSAVRSAVGGATYSTPTDQTLQLDAGKYVIYEQTGSSDGSQFPVTTTGPVDIAPQDVQITGPDGAAVDTDYPAGTDTINRNGIVYTGAVAFRAAHSGRYEIRVESESGSRVLVSKDIVSEVLSALIWVLGLVIGGLVTAVGFVLLIIHWTRRSRANRLPPPGWYPDPNAPLVPRFWNGYAWAPPGT
jgi:hypothetical protein